MHCELLLFSFHHFDSVSFKTISQHRGFYFAHRYLFKMETNTFNESVLHTGSLNAFVSNIAEFQTRNTAINR